MGAIGVLLFQHGGTGEVETETAGKEPRHVLIDGVWSYWCPPSTLSRLSVVFLVPLQMGRW